MGYFLGMESRDIGKDSNGIMLLSFRSQFYHPCNLSVTRL